MYSHYTATATFVVKRVGVLGLQKHPLIPNLTIKDSDASFSSYIISVSMYRQVNSNCLLHWPELFKAGLR